MTTTPASLAELLLSWQVALNAENKSPNTIAQYRDGVHAFLRWCEQTDTAPELSKPAVQGFLASLLNGGAQPATARAPATSLCAPSRRGWPLRAKSAPMRCWA